MKIKSLQLKNFKRFTDLTIRDIPETAKLVLLIGSNGSGKSSVFDAFERISTLALAFGTANYINQNEYYSKKSINNYKIVLQTFDNILFKNDEAFNYLPENNRFEKSFFGRTSFRQIPRLSRTGLGNKNFNIEKNSDRPISFIDRDERFENDLEHIFGKLLEEFFISDDSKSKIKSNVVFPINEAFERIFGEKNGSKLELQRIIPPLEGNTAQIIFLKGESEFHYNQLSAGEKEVFNILINLVARKEYYSDTVFFFDEIDLHLNTKLQYDLLKELTENWIPDNCQFWTASHSLGFIQYAKESEGAVIFDFDDYDFDYPKILTPEPKDNPEIYDIAIDKDFLSKLFVGFDIYFVENTDQLYYSLSNLPKKLFVPEKGRNAVYHKVKSGEYNGIIDRDYLSDDDITEISKYYPNLKILDYYSIENYLYHPDNIEEYNNRKNLPFDKEFYKAEIKKAKDQVIQELTIKIATIRNSYPFFDDPKFDTKENFNQRRFKNKEENFTNTALVVGYLNSNDFPTFYKSFSIKDHGTHLSERNHPPSELAQTTWFRKQIESIVK
ncbi:MAG: AAA family ATPase [Ginsengibacter sp.]